jgi:predicted ATPase/serine phosphatase RsbU (regulator of sigma subunit)
MNELTAQYTLSVKIRETPYSELHRGFRNADGAPVVVKLMRGSRSTPIDLARLRHEYELLKNLDAPQIVKTLGLVTQGRSLALVLEDAGEASLDQLILSGHLNLTRSLELAIALARTLAVVHSHRIVHKDIKPQHFFVRKNAPNTVVLVDFGIATRLSHELQTRSRVTDLEGTLAYIAPEQTGRMNRLVDCRSDLYSLGVTLYELFTGHLPFVTTDPLELVHCHIARIPPNPRVYRSDLPQPVVEIILKLLAKAAEERYQSAVGVEYDLERCLKQLSSNDTIVSFALGEHDYSGELAIPQKLYGRERELAELVATFERTRGGTKELFLLSGVAGVGKSVLVYELQQQLEHGGYFAAGKFDFLGSSVPYAPIAQAFRELIRAALAESPEVLASRKASLLEAVGPNGQLLIDLVPELALIIGPQPAVPALGASESQHRFELVFQNFLRTFAAAGHPLVLFLDDLQWADAGSLRLLQHVLTAPGLGYLLIIGAYRKNEVNATHPLLYTLQELRRAGTAITDLTLQPLELPHITQLLVEALMCKADSVGELASVLLEKTRGNPFFISQFLTTLYRDKLLCYSHEQQAWQWEIKQLSGRLATDNVVDFMLSRLHELPAATQEMLRFAACIGNQFDHESLVTVSLRSFVEVKRSLWDAVQQGLLIPLDGNYRFESVQEPDSTEPAEPAFNAEYRFLHDRVHQAAYALISDQDRAPVHLSIGRLLLSRAKDNPTEGNLFEVTDHLNRGRVCIEEPRERLRLVQLNLAAGRRARNAAAPGAAVQYLTIALELLGATPFGDHYDLALPIHLLKAECEYLTGNLDEALRLIALVESNARTRLEKVTARNLELTVFYKTGQLPAACSRVADTVRLLGGEMPDVGDLKALGGAIGAEFAAYQAAVAGRNIESLVDLPLMTDPTKLALLETLANGVPAAFGSNPPLHVILVLKGVQLLSHETAPLGGFFYEQYAIVHSVITGDLDTAFRYGQLGIESAKRTGDASTAGQVYFLFGGFTAHWRMHISQGLELLRSALRLALEAGDRFYAAFASSVTANYRLYAGENLLDVQVAINAAREVAEQAGDLVNLAFGGICQQAVWALQGKTNHLGTLNSANFDEATFEATVALSALPFYGTVKAMVRYLDGRPGEALAAATQWELPPGMFFHGENALYRTLSAIELMAHSESAEERAKLLERIDADVQTIERWAKAAPDNHSHRLALVQAELAAIQGRQAEAMDLYDRAIRLAQEHGFLNQEALANELAARFHWSLKRRTVARAYILDAMNAYQRWGAEAKLKVLHRQYPALFDDVALGESGATSRLFLMEKVGHLDATIVQDNDSTTLQPHGRLDLATAIRATEAIATELVVDQLWERLMRTLLENAGAQRGCLILEHTGVLQVEATIAIEPNVVKLGLAAHLDDGDEAPPTLVQYVARTSEPVVLADAIRDARFASDPYVARVRPKSVLCVPMLQRGKLAGVLYLENNVATNAFSPARTELLQFLATQAAVAFENAKLYSQLTAATDELRRSNERLENEVAQRTTELRRTVADLWSEMDLARKIQTVLLPKHVRLSHYDVAASMVPADSVGGDYYDMIEAGERDWLLIGDVSGHGVTAGLIMMMIQTAVRAIVLGAPTCKGLSPAQLLSFVNHSVHENLQRVSADQYMTITALELGQGTIRFSGLHQDLLIHRAASNTTERVETRGMWLGIMEDIAPLMYDDQIELAPGDTLLLHTDGISEHTIEGNRMLEVEGLRKRFQSLAEQKLEPAAIVRGLLGPFSAQSAADDMTVVVVRYAPLG